MHSYKPGDIAVITPKNLPEEVDQFLEQMQWTELAHMPLHLEPTAAGTGANRYPNEGTYFIALDRKLPPNCPPVTTLHHLVTHYLDVFGVPRRSFFEMLAHFTQDELQTERLREFASSEGQVSLACTLDTLCIICRPDMWILGRNVFLLSETSSNYCRDPL